MCRFRASTFIVWEFSLGFAVVGFEGFREIHFCFLSHIFTFLVSLKIPRCSDRIRGSGVSMLQKV